MKRYILSIICMILLSLAFVSVRAQDNDEEKVKEENPYKLKGLQYGINFGVYFANNKIASYYNGDPDHTLSLQRILIDNVDFNGNPISENYIHKEIREKEFNGDDFELDLSYRPIIKYSAATNIGFDAKYNINDNWGIYLDINFVKLKAQGQFYIRRLNTTPGSIVPLYQYNLLANESRVDINLGVARSFGIPGIFKPYIEGALNLNNTNVKSADALIGNDKYSYLNQYNEYYKIRDDGIGTGALLGGGIQVLVGQTIVMHAGADFSLKKIHLGDNKKYNLNTIIYVRLLFRNLISTKEEA